MPQYEKPLQILLARGIVDMLGGHPAGSNCHYHFIPERLKEEFLSDWYSGIVGYINDGFPIYVYKVKEEWKCPMAILTSVMVTDTGYHYHATLEYPYTVGRYMGTPFSTSSNESPWPGGRASRNSRLVLRHNP